MVQITKNKNGSTDYRNDTPGQARPGAGMILPEENVEMKHNVTDEGRGIPRPSPSDCSDGRCPTCRQRNSRAGERERDDGSVIVWYCNVPGCANHEDHPNEKMRGGE